MQQGENQGKNISIKVHYSHSIDSDIRKSQETETYQERQAVEAESTPIESHQQQNKQANQSVEQSRNNKLEKLANFIHFHHIDQNQIWKSKKEIQVQDFVDWMVQNYAYSFSYPQIEALEQICYRKNLLRPKEFQQFGLWKSQQNFSARFLTSYNLQKSKKSIPKILNKSKDTINTSNYFNQSEKTQSEQSIKSNFHITKSGVKFSIKPRKDFNQETFDEAKRYSEAKVKLKVEQLKKDIKESVLQKKWDFIVMAGEMNQWIDQLKKQNDKKLEKNEPQPILSYRYKIINRDPVEIIQENIELGDEEQIPHVVFVKKYQTLKKRMVKEQNHKNNLKGTVLMVLEDNDKLNKNNLNNRINQRDQQLNFVLLQVMRMKSIFQWQNNILKQAKINS